MEPIINPWTIYLIQMVDSINDGLMVFGVMFTVGWLYIAFVNMAEETEEDEAPKKVEKKLSWWPLSLIALSILCPSRDTVIAMLVANEITEDRVELVGEKAVDLRNAIKSDILDIVREVQDNADK